jgi:hypothetical protein
MHRSLTTIAVGWPKMPDEFLTTYPCTGATELHQPNAAVFRRGGRGLGLRAYFMPEDDTSTIYIYDVDAQ